MSYLPVEVEHRPAGAWSLCGQISRKRPADWRWPADWRAGVGRLAIGLAGSGRLAIGLAGVGRLAIGLATSRAAAGGGGAYRLAAGTGQGGGRQRQLAPNDLARGRAPGSPPQRYLADDLKAAAALVVIRRVPQPGQRG